MDQYYDFKNKVLKNKRGIEDAEVLKQAEADFVACRIGILEESNLFQYSIDFFKHVHYYLFRDIYEWAGEFRTLDIQKEEAALNGLTITYAKYQEIESKLQVIFDETRGADIKNLTHEDKVKYIMEVMLRLWHVHPFREGNTRTVILFICKYCKALGLEIDKDILMNNCKYVRRSLVAASFGEEEEEAEHKKWLNDIMQEMIKEDPIKKKI